MQEIEAKYYLGNLAAFRKRLTAQGGKLIHPRVLETNLRFDTPGADLSQQYRVLRLRKAHTVTLTYKGMALMLDGVSQRQEIETEVGDFETARALLEGLGYQVVRTYEKFRTEYLLNGLLVTLDELPYGDFVEIEGQRAADIRQLAARLELDTSVNVPVNYLSLLDRFNLSRNLQIRDLTFENLEDFTITPQDLGVTPAD